MSVRLPKLRKMISPRRTGEKTHASRKTTIKPRKACSCRSLTRPMRRSPSAAARSLSNRARLFASDSCQLNDALLCRFMSFERTSDHAFAHDDDAITQCEQFRQLGGHQDDAQPARGQFFNQAIDFGLAFNVYSFRRFVQEQHARRG